MLPLDSCRSTQISTRRALLPFPVFGTILVQLVPQYADHCRCSCIRPSVVLATVDSGCADPAQPVAYGSVLSSAGLEWPIVTVMAPPMSRMLPLLKFCSTPP